MKILQSYLLTNIIRVTINSIAFCTILILMLDLFTNINKYISNDISIMRIIYFSVLYIPKAISYSISPAVLFSVTYSISSMHAKNELISILNSGISYYVLIRNILILGLLISVLVFAFQEYVVIDTFAKKQTVTNEAIGYSTSYNNNNVVLISKDSHQIYYARYYNDRRKELSNLIVLTRDSSGTLTSRQDISRAVYNEETQGWDLFNVTTYIFDTMGRTQTSSDKQISWTDASFMPKDFRDITYDIQEMHLSEASSYIKRIRTLDYNKYLSLLTDYYERFSFSLTPLIVMIISCSVGSRFKKNILLNSLLLCIIISVLYFVFEMITILLAKQHYIPPFFGAWLPIIIFSVFGLLLLKHVRT